MCAQLVIKQGHGIATSDGGANSGILGNGWRLVYKTHRKANITGFHPDFAKRNGCLIGTFYTVAKDEDGREVILIYHEGVQNKDCQNSLLSEFQMREYGTIVDSTSKKHMAMNGEPGKQCMIVIVEEEDEGAEENTAIIPFQNFACLMSFECREPTDDEIRDLPKYVLTSPAVWEPSKHYPDNSFISDPVSNDVVAANTKADSIDEDESSCGQDEQKKTKEQKDEVNVASDEPKGPNTSDIRAWITQNLKLARLNESRHLLTLVTLKSQ